MKPVKIADFQGPTVYLPDIKIIFICKMMGNIHIRTIHGIYYIIKRTIGKLIFTNGNSWDLSIGKYLDGILISNNNIWDNSWDLLTRKHISIVKISNCVSFTILSYNRYMGWKSYLIITTPDNNHPLEQIIPTAFYRPILIHVLALYLFILGVLMGYNIIG